MTYKENIKAILECCFTGFKEEIIDSACNRILEQEPCEDEYIKIPKKALKYRTAGMIAYNAEWLKNHFDIERAVICGAQQPSDDAISRQAVLDMMQMRMSGKELYKAVYDLPPVNPQPKMGRWIYGEDNLGTGRDGWYCNQCGHFEFWNYSSDMKSAKLNLPNPCPDCGAKMVETQGWEK